MNYVSIRFWILLAGVCVLLRLSVNVLFGLQADWCS